MAFNLTKYRESLEVPTLLIQNPDGTETVLKGELVSFNTMVPLLERLTDPALTLGDLESVVRDVITAMKMPPEAAEAILTLPQNGIVEALHDFFECLRGRPNQP